MYKRLKALRNKYNGFFKLLLVPERPWINILIDFIIDLSKCKRYSQIYDAILIVVDKLSKKKHYILRINKDKGTILEAIGYLFFWHVRCKQDILISIMSDKRLQFVAKIWKFLCKLLGIEVKLFTAYHPQADGQSKIAN